MKNNQVRRVDFFDNSQDYEAAFLGSLGFSTRCIMRHTKLRPGQITYRLKKAAIRRIDYRDGNSDTASMILRHMRPSLEKELSHYLRDTLLTQPK
jgi:hypothetical protein